MPSVTRDKKKYGAPTVGGDTSPTRDRQVKERERIRGEEMRMDHRARNDGNEYYHTGRVRPLINDGD